jgi:hypothetical protein
MASGCARQRVGLSYDKDSESIDTGFEGLVFFEHFEHQHEFKE